MFKKPKEVRKQSLIQFMSSRNSTKNVGEIVIMCTIQLYVFRQCRNKGAWVGFFFLVYLYDHLMNKT